MQRFRSKKPREGVAMLVVMLVLLMTTATATFAIHSTSMELRSAGYGRQAIQAEYLAQGATNAAAARLDMIGPCGLIVESQRTDVAANTASRVGAPTVDRATNLFRVQMEDFTARNGAAGPAIETAAGNVPSLGPSNAYVPNFTVDGTDLHRIARLDPGTEASGRGADYHAMTLTAYATMAPPGDFRASGDSRDFHETAMRARAVVVVGPSSCGGR